MFVCLFQGFSQQDSSIGSRHHALGFQNRGKHWPLLCRQEVSESSQGGDNWTNFICGPFPFCYLVADLSFTYASVNSACAQPPPPGLLSVPGVGHLQILHCPGAGHLLIPGHSRAFDTHAVSYHNNIQIQPGLKARLPLINL